VTSQSHPYARFRRAVERGNVTEALSAARELQHVGLADALELCLLLRDKAPEKYERAALRWHGLYCREVIDVCIVEGQAVLAMLAAIAGPRGKPAARDLAELLDRRGPQQATKELLSWSHR
jgi:hypothetical protein